MAPEPTLFFQSRVAAFHAQLCSAGWRCAEQRCDERCHANPVACCAAGEGEAFCEDERMPVGPGDLVVFSPGAVHGIDVRPAGRMYCLELMLPNDQFAEVVRSGREMVGGLEDQDLRVMASAPAPAAGAA
jgi:hypothetical protein